MSNIYEAEMRTGRAKRPLILTADEQERLQSLAHRARSQPVLARRARVILASAQGLANHLVARQLRCSPGMVNKWRSRFLKSRLEGLYDEPRPGAPRKVSDAQVEDVVIRTLESTPAAQTHWSTRGLAQATGLSRMTIGRIWRAFGLQPRRTETFKLSPDPLLIEKVRDIGWQGSWCGTRGVGCCRSSLPWRAGCYWSRHGSVARRCGLEARRQSTVAV